MIEELKLLGTERISWTQEQQHPYLAIRTWEDMKIAMTRQFVPIDYRQRVEYRFSWLTQGSMTVEEYTSRFYRLATRLEFP